MSKNFSYALALTGSIASGKSTVASLLKLHGLQCIDADATAHEVLIDYPQEIAELFGEQYLTKGKVDRKKLGSLIFADQEAKAKLEAFMHPKIRERILEKSLRFEKLKFPYLIVIPLFFETNAYEIETSVVVYTPKDVQLERLIKRNGLSEEESLQRIAAQMDIEDKKARADFVIDNSGDLKHLQEECELFVEKMKKLKLG
jgi:dephospho-CoA kinase